MAADSLADESAMQTAAELPSSGAAVQGGLLDELAVKYGCNFDSVPHGGFCASEQAAPPAHPLAWFGAIVSPSLREAERDFKSGELCSAAVHRCLYMEIAFK